MTTTEEQLRAAFVSWWEAGNYRGYTNPPPKRDSMEFAAFKGGVTWRDAGKPR